MKRARILFLAVLLIFSLWTVSDALPTRTKFLSSDLTVAINSTVVDGVGFTSKTISLAYCTYASITLYVKGGNAGCSLNVIFKFVAFDSLRNQWDTIAYITVDDIPANGTTAVQKTIPVTPDIERIKLFSVQNQETTTAYTVTVNASIFYK